MNIRLIAGTFGGRIIEGSGTSRTHPMGERIRGSMFNIIGSEIKGAKVLDAFAGSGALGLESISRGAAFATFIERDRVAQKIIENNINKLAVANKTKLVKAPLASWLNTTLNTALDTTLGATASTTLGVTLSAISKPELNPNNDMIKDERYDIIFADPPYNDLQLSTVFSLQKLLKPNGLMVLSYTGRGEVPTDLGVVVVDNRRYGDAVLSFYRRESA